MRIAAFLCTGVIVLAFAAASTPAYAPTPPFGLPLGLAEALRAKADKGAAQQVAQGLGGTAGGSGVSTGASITAMDPLTAKIAWRHELPGGGAGGMLMTAGRLLFAGDGAANIVGYDVANGKPVWHSRIGAVSNAPETYMLDGKQYLLVAAGDMLAAFSLYAPVR